MTIYYILILLWLILYIGIDALYKEDKHKRNKVYTIIVCMTLIFVMGFRDKSVGTDTKQYLYMFNDWYTLDVVKTKLYNNSELGFQLFDMFLKWINISDQQYIFIISTVIAISFSILFYKNSKNLFLTFFLHLTIGLFGMSMSGIRQTLAICITMLAFHYMKEEKPFKYLLSVVIAYTFHNSAICFLPMYLFRNVKITQKRGIILLIIAGLILAFREYFMPLVQAIMPSKYDGYFINGMNININPLVIAIAFVILVICTYLWKSIKDLDESEKKEYYLLYIMTFFYLFTTILSLNLMIISRLNFYFLTYAILLLTNILSVLKDKKTKTL